MEILIVDDSMTIRAMIKKALELSVSSPSQVYEADNGITALARLAEKKIDLILTDINMPRMDGLQLIEKLRSSEKFSHIPIVVITTDSSRDRIEELQQQGISGYLHKPFRPEQLKQILTKIEEPSDECQPSHTGQCDF